MVGEVFRLNVSFVCFLGPEDKSHNDMLHNDICLSIVAMTSNVTYCI